jgi:DNA primase
MNQTFTKEFLEELKEKNDIVGVASEYFKLIDSGENYKAHCIHKGGDKTPSLVFYPDSQSFYCFSCGAGKRNGDTQGSDVISLIQWVENLTWQESVVFLARRVGLDLPKTNLTIEEKRKLKQYEQALKENKKYWKNLSNKPCNHILKWYNDKGIETQDIAKWRLGASKFGSKWVPTYSIMDEQGRTCGFSMRAGTDQAKYVNSSNSDIFKKGDILYGLNFIKKEIRENKFAIIVEGYNDAIMLQKFGAPAVATMGTSITKEQIVLLKKYTDTVILFLDGDEAGIKSTITNIKEFKKEGFKVEVLNILGFDPDEVALKYKNDILDFILNNRKLAFQFLINSVLDRYFDKMIRLKKETINELEEILEYIDDKSERTLYREQLVKIVSSGDKESFERSD